VPIAITLLRASKGNGVADTRTCSCGNLNSRSEWCSSATAFTSPVPDTNPALSYNAGATEITAPGEGGR
jgi:hypothetical protein